MGSLAAPFVAKMSEDALLRATAIDGLEAVLCTLIEEAQSARPEIADALSEQHFAAYLGDRVGDEAFTLESLQSLRAGDLFLACACLERDSRALAAFEHELSHADAALARMNLGGAVVEDVKQAIRHRLLVGDGDSPAKLLDYKGRGDLRAWLRVSATRAALKVIRSNRRERPLEDEMLMDLESNDADPELRYVKALYRDAFRTAFQGALDSLEDREKNLLRQHVVDQLSIDELGTLYQVHRATAARWVTKAKENLLEATRAKFMGNVRVDNDECDSIMRLVQSQLDGTIRRRLGGA
jgi:RNA polymerase sigma-70 factor (ECF subfamily)